MPTTEVESILEERIADSIGNLSLGSILHSMDGDIWSQQLDESQSTLRLALPIGAHGKYVYRVTLDIIFFLLPGIFRKHFVNITAGTHNLGTLRVGEERLLAFARVELIGGNTNHQAITQFPQALEQTDVTNMEEVKSPVGKNSFHGAKSSTEDDDIVTLGLAQAAAMR